MNTWSENLKRSQAWVKDNEDIVIRMLQAVDIFNCEGSTDALKRHLDTSCGTDYFVVHESGSTHAVGSRFQEDARQGGRKWETFTIRASRDSGAKTEYEKLVTAIKRDTQRPQLTMQGYIGEDGKIDRMAVARTKDIIDYIQKVKPEMKHTGADQNGQAWFYPIEWEDFKEHGYPIKIYKNGEII